ncbi:hypothetical protein NW761_013320 [Fusarium oxysporum]|nr:hypothetical protein NW758_015192 [Fusarium oxysporum]KAJ4074930.1 hypothetical protein NW761_013320 [Fusarium oxysporum]
MSYPSDYTVGWICALSIEAVAATIFLDHEIEGPATQAKDDTNNYIYGRIQKHNVVIATLPVGEYGTATAASVAKDLTRSFPNVRIGLMVGIGGGAPSLTKDIRLGDVVVSTPSGEHGGIFQYDYGKSLQDQVFQHTRILDQPPQLLRSAVSRLQVQHRIHGNGLQESIATILEQYPRLRDEYGRPSDSTDILFNPAVVHAGGESCDICDKDETDIVNRKPREHQKPWIHYGIIASANSLMKNAMLRDKLATQKGVLCFETEAAGLMNGFSCLVIRGICDYSDSHKNKVWQGYAAMAAAAYAKQIISTIRPERIEELPRLGKIETQVREIAQTTQDIRSHQERGEASRILAWLSHMDFVQQQTDNLRKWQPGTIRWLLESPEYQRWVEEKGEILFCPGFPGAGKTVSASVVVNNLTQRFAGNTTIGIAFFYCSYTQKDKQYTTGILSGILKQLCQLQPSIPKDVKSLYIAHQNGQTRLQYNEIFSALESHFADYSRVMIIVDALDEWEPPRDDQSNFVDELLLLHEQFQINLFVTSRFIPAIEEKFHNYPSLDIKASKDDIYQYIESYQWPLPSFVRSKPALQQQIKFCVSQAAKGMFLLARFYLRSLECKTTPRELMDALKLFQNRAERKDHDQGVDMLAEAYDEVMDRINQQSEGYRRKAYQVMSWVCYANKELHARELQDAIAVRENDVEVHQDDLSDINLLLSVCCGIVVLNKATQTVQLVHYTAQDYFINRHQDWFPNVHSYLAKQCINYLCLPKLQYVVPILNSERVHWDELSGRYPLYTYAAANWGLHLRNTTTPCSGVDQAALSLLHNEDMINALIQVQLSSISYNQFPGNVKTKDLSINGLHLAAFCGLDRAIQLLVKHFDVNSRDSNGQTALGWASSWDTGFNGVRAVEHLIKAGADIHAVDRKGDTALHITAMSNCHKIAQLLLSNGARFDVSNGSGKLPLNIAVQRGSQSVYETLCQMGASPRSCGNNRRTVLMDAVWVNNGPLVETLLQDNVDLEARDYLNRTVLMEACEKGYGSIVEILLQHGTRLDTKDRMGCTALMKAIDGGHRHAARLLLQHGADQGVVDNHGYTALIRASKARRLEIVQLLLQYAAEMGIQDLGVAKALEEASAAGYLEIASELIDSDLQQGDRSLAPSDYWNALSQAHGEDHAGVFQLFLEKGALILHSAAGLKSCNKATTERLMLEASKTGNEEMVRWLIELGTNVSCVGEGYLTPIMLASKMGHNSIVQLLRAQGATFVSHLVKKT